MIGHMTLSMATPLFLVLGAPLTLLLRAVHPRADGSRGPREWAVGVTESRYVKVLTHPVVVSFLFAGSLVLFYFSPLFQVALTTHVGHELMHVHFLFAGYLMAWMMIGIDPGPHRPTPPLRLVMLFITMAFHAFFGIALIQMTTVLAQPYWESVGRTWGDSLLADQRYGGGIAWGIGEVPTLALAVILAIQWSMSDTREARRLDRAADRDGDAELGAYNDMLARMAAADAAARERGRAPRRRPGTGRASDSGHTKVAGPARRAAVPAPLVRVRDAQPPEGAPPRAGRPQHRAGLVGHVGAAGRGPRGPTCVRTPSARSTRSSPRGTAPSSCWPATSRGTRTAPRTSSRRCSAGCTRGGRGSAGSRPPTRTCGGWSCASACRGVAGARTASCPNDPGALPVVGVDDGTAQQAERDAMLRYLSRFSTRQRAVLVLRHYEDLTDFQIAEVLGIREGTVRSHAMVGLDRLRTLMAEDAAGARTGTDGPR